MNVDLSQTIVFDNGSGTIKAGLGSESVPKCIIQNRVARPKTGEVKGGVHVGLPDDFSKLSIKYPMEHGIVTDWDDMERVWQHVYRKQLDVSPEEHPVLITEPPLNSRSNREKVVEIFFETFKVPAMYISMQATLALYSTGRITGLVLDSGDGVTNAVPIYQGFAIPEGIKRVDFAGREVTEYLRMLLKKEGLNFSTTADFEIVNKIKESACYLGENPIIEENNFNNPVDYVLPDGNKIQIGPARFRAAEVLFRPQFLGRECGGLHEILYGVIEDSDLDLRSTLFKNIVLTGGSTLFKGFGSRLLSELRAICPKQARLRISAPKERLYCVWIGGSILASISTFNDAIVSREMYEEKGNQAFYMSNVMLDHYYSTFNKHRCQRA